MSDPFITEARLTLNPKLKNPDPLSSLRSRLVFKGSQKHIHPGDSLFPEYLAFLEAVRNNQFLKYLHDNQASIDFKSLKSSPLVATLPDRLIESQFIDAPVSTTRAVRSCYRDLSPQAASSVAVWNVITLHNIASGHLKDSYLAATSERVPGHVRIERALNGVRKNWRRKSENQREKNRKAVDGCVRTVFRNMGGLHDVRGHTSVISDCTLSRHWWMGHFVELASAELELDMEDAWYALNRSWKDIAPFAIKQLTILAIPSLMIGLIAHLIDSPVRNSRELTGKKPEGLLLRIGREFSIVDLHAWTAAKVRDHLREMRKAAA